MNAAVVAAALALSTANARPITLPEAYKAALQRSETIARDRESLAEINARIDEIWSAVKPRVSFFATEQVQDTPAGSSGLASSFSQRYRPQAGISAHQPLFSGFREFMAAKAASAQSEASRSDLRRSEQKLYADVAAAYLDLLSIQKEISTRLEIADLTGGRIKELRQRERVGRSRTSEVLAAESLLSQVESDVASARGRERVAQFNLRFITGLDGELLPAEVSVSSPAALADYLKRAGSRPDVEARRRDSDAARFNVDVYKRQNWPTIAADGNYYVKRPDGFQRDIKWDATLSLSLPIYFGGAISAQTEQARAKSRGADLDFARTQ
ncbi:MAG: TolC family protein, partial [Elusimicrobia bacterium]|nr:TolC family protein [Elusimicrobiota bacterium]